MTSIYTKENNGRLAFRVEGDNWVAYWARPNTMKGAVFLGCVHMVVTKHPDRKRVFMALMQHVAGDMVEARVGQRPLWNVPVEAPDHERGGHA